MSIFVDRQNVIEYFDEISQRNSPQWLLLLDGIEGIGKTAVLNQLNATQTAPNRLISLDFASPILRNDPLTLLNRLASELPVTPFQQFTTDLLKAYEGLERAHIKTENKIVVNRGSIFTGDIVQTASGQTEIQESETDTTLKRLFVECNISLAVEGTVSNNQIVQIASVNLGQALRNLKQHIRDELTTRFIKIVDDYLQSRTNEQIIVFIDNLDRLQDKARGPEYLEWFLNSLLATIHRRFATRLRVVMTNKTAANWSENHLQQARKISLEPLTLNDVKNYCQQRNISRERIIQGIFDLTQGHPLCLVMAVDLYGLAPGIGVRGLQQYATDPFDSRLLAYRLFRAIVNHMPDEAMKKILRYGPIFRILDDDAIENILAVELGIAKDQIKEILEKLRDYAILEDTDEIIFRPVIQEQVLVEFRQNMADDPIYRKLNRRAYEWYGQQWLQATGRQKTNFRYQMAFHEVNLVPQNAEQIVKHRVDEAFREGDPEQAYRFMEWAQQDKSISLSPKELQEWEKKAPEEIHLDKTESPMQTEENDSNIFGDIIRFLSGGGVIIFGFMKKGFTAVKNYITSPLRTLERHLRRSKKLNRRQQKIYKNLTQKQIPKIDSIRQEAQDLRQRIVSQELPNAENCKTINAQLVEHIQRALSQQQRNGYISSGQFDQISQQFSQQNKTIGDYNRQVRRFDKKYRQFSNSIQKIQDIITDSDNKRSEMNQQNEALYQESQSLFESGRAMVFHDAKEEKRAIQLIDEIQEYYREIKNNSSQVQSALDEFWRVQPPAVQAINSLHDSIEQMNIAIAAANSLLGGVAGVELVSDDHRSMIISVRNET